MRKLMCSKLDIESAALCAPGEMKKRLTEFIQIKDTAVLIKEFQKVAKCSNLNEFHETKVAWKKLEECGKEAISEFKTAVDFESAPIQSILEVTRLQICERLSPFASQEE
jgi:hypothetical protein